MFINSQEIISQTLLPYLQKIVSRAISSSQNNYPVFPLTTLLFVIINTLHARAVCPEPHKWMLPCRYMYARNELNQINKNMKITKELTSEITSLGWILLSDFWLEHLLSCKGFLCPGLVPQRRNRLDLAMNEQQIWFSGCHWNNFQWCDCGNISAGFQTSPPRVLVISLLRHAMLHCTAAVVLYSANTIHSQLCH